MTLQATYVHKGDSIDYTPAANVAVGDVVVQNELVGVAKKAIVALALGALAVKGVFDFAKATGSGTSIAVGEKVYWNDSLNVATTTAGSNKLMGKCVKAAATTDATVRVRLNQ